MSKVADTAYWKAILPFKTVFVLFCLFFLHLPDNNMGGKMSPLLPQVVIVGLYQS